MELKEKIGDWGYSNWQISQLKEEVENQHQALKKLQIEYHYNIERQNAELKELLNEIKAEVKPEQELWDGSDMIRNWKVSERTLATWRSKGLIDFVQVGSKIWYPREARELFLRKYYNEAKVVEERVDGE